MSCGSTHGVHRVASVLMELCAAIGAYATRDPGRSTPCTPGAGGAVRPRNDLAAVLGVTQAEVRMVMYDVGGTNGHPRCAPTRNSAWWFWVARRVGRLGEADVVIAAEAFLSDYQMCDLAG